jgi:hypothetical protein
VKLRQNWFLLFLWIGLVSAGIFLGGLQAARAQDTKPDLIAVVRDTQKVSNAGGRIDIAWWLPDEYWRISLENSNKVTPSQTENVLKLVHPYFIVGMVSGKTGDFGAMTYRSVDEIRGMLQLKDGEGNIYKPLGDDKIDASLRALLGVMKPILGKMLGPMGENMNFYVFEGLNQGGTRRYDPLKDGSFAIDMGEREFKWRLPLDSLLAKQKCPTCGEELSGTYKYCPYDGTKLAAGK